MGDNSNFFHCQIVRPRTVELLQVQPRDLILDIACGTGNFSEWMAKDGADVIAFDFSEKMIEHAKRRRSAYQEKISFHACDATEYEEILSLKQDRPFDKAVANMALMDMAAIRPLFRAVAEMLKPGGIFVFSTHHPCFERPPERYLTPGVHEGVAIRGQPEMQYYYHRPLQDLLQVCFDSGFVMDAFFEEPDDMPEFPAIILVRLIHQKKTG